MNLTIMKYNMRNLKRVKRHHLKLTHGGRDISDCFEYCPAGPYGPDQPKSCADFHALPECCKGRVLVSYECFDPHL
ncbi:hypothetical protein F3J23_01425 [Chryseobacterium sp. Tr-659]|uniref:hypothetical protein n=1 Tax=Chryseobacterium sp. Tr-659 TaxID=2608340 RepID=UPI00141FAC54|nr:hypothetical protein [Chryseobacterium sp. Tr-659]NIF04086.1 hypothetical protein [Chryseobacterium sp. Tr-659]